MAWPFRFAGCQIIMGTLIESSGNGDTSLPSAQGACCIGI
jgi:hypothetical protein